MNKVNYSKICSGLLKGLPSRQKEVIARRFGLQNANSQKETLDAIGKSQNITRERVRQIEKEGLDALKTRKQELKELKAVFQNFSNYFKKQGGIKKEDLLLEALGSKQKNQVFFLLNLDDQFKRFGETEDFHSFWEAESGVFGKAEKFINAFFSQLQKTGQLAAAPKSAAPAYLEISKKIQQAENGLFGLKKWPEVNPRGVKDKAYLIFKKEQQPLHFTQVAVLIGQNALPQTVHNELIKDARFVLVGRGLYALQEWGYTAGVVKDVIMKVLGESKNPLSKEAILSAVLKQRFVKENTVFLNLSDKNCFAKNENGFYSLKTQTA